MINTTYEGRKKLKKNHTKEREAKNIRNIYTSHLTELIDFDLRNPKDRIKEIDIKSIRKGKVRNKIEMKRNPTKDED